MKLIRALAVATVVAMTSALTIEVALGAAVALVTSLKGISARVEVSNSIYSYVSSHFDWS